MKSAQINEYGDPSVIKIVDIEKPKINEDQVLVKVHASSINPFDTAIRAGYMKDNIPLKLPITLGGDIAGEVSEIGGSATNLAVGDKVYGQANVVAGNSGAFAEFAATAEQQIAIMPNNLDFLQAASLPLVAVSAWQGLVEHINLKPNQKIFIHGGAGGIGTIAIQIAKNIGAYVATTATGEDIDYVKSLGADEVIDYKTQDFSEALSDYDAVFDAVGGDDFAKSYLVLKEGGVAVSMIAQVDEEKAKEQKIEAIRQMTNVTKNSLNSIRELVESGIVKPQLDKTFKLDEISQAFELKESGKVRGKIVIKID
ncbi:NADP-dependent oxidoreductase [Candidatus Saccharibacteria bacterium]|nr:NADP-dependent oxidoreductase [Candidatus Saccharibacteria bacterium]